MRYLKLFKRYSWIKFLELVEYRTSFFLGLFSGLTFLVINLLFWGVIYSHTTQINGWTFAQIILLQGFFHLFLTIFWMFFAFADKIDRLVIHGNLDKMLARPINVLVAYSFQEIDWFSLMDLIESLVYFFVAIHFGVNLTIGSFLIALFLLFLAILIFALVIMTVSCFSFWIGKTQALNALWYQIWDIAEYPLTIFPLKIQFFLTFILPLIFIQTYPSMIASNQLVPQFIIKSVAIELVLILVWFLIAVFTWRKGLKRYASYGG